MKRVWIIVQGANENAEAFSSSINEFITAREVENKDICPSSHEFQFTTDTFGRQTCNVVYYIIKNRKGTPDTDGN